MIITVGKLYRVKDSVYDFWDESSYIIRIISKAKSLYEEHAYYEAHLISINGTYKIHFYPVDWGHIQELSSLESELV